MLILLLNLILPVHAELLQPIELRLPVDEAVVKVKCEAAFLQALKDKENYENRPEVNLMCALNLNHKQMETLRLGFLQSCVSTFKVRSAGVPSGETVIVDLRALRNAFDGDYAAIFRTICLDRSVNAFHVRQAQERQGQASGQSYVPAARCSGFASCQSEASR